MTECRKKGVCITSCVCIMDISMQHSIRAYPIPRFKAGISAMRSVSKETRTTQSCSLNTLAKEVQSTATEKFDIFRFFFKRTRKPQNEKEKKRYRYWGGWKKLLPPFT